MPSPLDSFQGGNGLMPARPVAQPAPQAQPSYHIPMHVTRRAHANVGQDVMIKRRDAMGDVAEELAKVMNSEQPNRADIAAYIGGMIRKGIIEPDEATQLLRALPENPDGIRQWARVMFSAAMNVGIHAHAAYPQEVFPSQGQQATAAAPAMAGAEEQTEPRSLPNV